MAEAIPQAPLLITRWTRQDERLPPALAPGHARFDERSFTDMIAEAAHFGRCVRFFDLDDSETGTWDSLLDSDGTVLLALIASFDVRRHCDTIRALLRRLHGDEDSEQREAMLRRIVDELRRLVTEIDRWLGPVDRLGDTQDARAAAALIRHVVDEAMAPRLRELMGILAAAERAGRFDTRIPLLTNVCHRRWRIDRIDDAFPLFDRDAEGFWIDAMIEPIETAVDSFLDGAEALVDGAAAALEASLDHPDHRPHVALLLAFARLFRHAQHRINALPGRISRFYHERMIGGCAHGAAMDRLYLAFTPARLPDRPPSSIPAGETFEAGEDEAGVPIRFAAEAPLTVTGAQVEEARLWRPETIGGRRRRVAVTRIAVAPDGAVAEAFAAAAPAPAAGIGLILAGTELEAASGERIVKLTFDLSGLDWPDRLGAQSFADLLGQAFRLSISSPEGWIDVTAVETQGAAVGAAAGGRARAVFGFSLPADDAPLVRGGVAGMPDAPAIRLLLVQDPLGLPGTDGAPVEVAPLRMFAEARFDGLRVDIAVAGLGGLELSTSSGPVAAISGIPAFGNVAARGSWLRADHPALLAGTIDRLALTLAWADLPADPHGLYGHYLEYVVGPDRRVRRRSEPLFHNDVFRVRLEAPLAGGTASFNLFPSAAPAGPLPPFSTFAVAAAEGDEATAAPPAIAGGVRLILVAPDYGFGESLYPVNVAYAAAAAAGEAGREQRREELSARLARVLVKLLMAPLRIAAAAAAKLAAWDRKLEEWDAAFTGWVRDLVAWARGRPAGLEPGASRGDAVARPWRTAAEKLAAWGKALTAWIRGLAAGPEAGAIPPDTPVPAKPLLPVPRLNPNPPWRPTLADISLDYAAHCEAGEGSLALFHLSALDGPVPVEAIKGAALLPRLPPTPCLDLRVAGWSPGHKLSLLILLAGGAAAPPPLRWLAGDGGVWRELEPPALRDGTNCLAASGLVTLDLPGRAVGDVWLRIALDAADAALPDIAAVMPDALSARRLPFGTEVPVDPIPAGTIATASLAGIVAVRQPLDSFGGRPAEATMALGARVAERLRHKQRAVLDWDVERIVLEAFPDIARVRALPGRGPSGEKQAGGVLVVVVPGPGGASPPDPLRPRATATMRAAIEEHLGRRASPFARIAVVDPAYAAADVAAAIALAPAAMAASVEAAVRAFLSPWAEQGPDLPDRSAAADLAGALVAFLRGLDGVEAVADVAVTLADAAGQGWIVPVAGQVRIHLVQAAALGA